MNKIVINICHGGFSVSPEARKWMEERMSLCPERLWDHPEESDFEFSMVSDLPRFHPVLVAAVEKFGPKANGVCATLKVVEIPGNRFKIHESAGAERVTTPETTTWDIIPPWDHYLGFHPFEAEK